MNQELPQPTPPKDPRHHLFAVLMLQLKNRTDAYLGAGYKCSRQSAAVGGSRLMRNPEIDEFICLSLAIERAKKQAAAEEKRRQQFACLNF